MLWLGLTLAAAQLAVFVSTRVFAVSPGEMSSCYKMTAPERPRLPGALPAGNWSLPLLPEVTGE